MSSSDLRDRMDGLEWENPVGKMDAVFPGSSVQFHNQCTGGVQASPVNNTFTFSASYRMFFNADLQVFQFSFLAFVFKDSLIQV